LSTEPTAPDIRRGDRVRSRADPLLSGRVTEMRSCGGVIVRWFGTREHPDGPPGGYYHPVALEIVPGGPPQIYRIEADMRPLRVFP
jgi:hypothetical protein